jgi:hypothetical protein
MQWCRLFCFSCKLRTLTVYELLIHKHFACINNNRSKISLSILQTLHGSMHARDVLAYFDCTVSYTCKMFMKLTVGGNIIKLVFNCH